MKALASGVGMVTALMMIGCATAPTIRSGATPAAPGAGEAQGTLEFVHVDDLDRPVPRSETGGWPVSEAELTLPPMTVRSTPLKFGIAQLLLRGQVEACRGCATCTERFAREGWRVTDADDDLYPGVRFLFSRTDDAIVLHLLHFEEEREAMAD